MFVEGLKTEEQYLVRWHRVYRQSTMVTIDGFRGGPLQLVQQAVERKRVDARDQKKGRGRMYDEYWCVFDVDEHPGMAQAVDLARRSGIQIAVSNPCIEVWFILHFEDQTAWIHRNDAQARSQDLLTCSKSLTDAAFELLRGQYTDARNRARALDVKHDGDGSPARSNPSSGLWRLIDSISGE